MGSVLSVSFSVDGSSIISSSFDKTIRMWDAVTGDALGYPLRGHGDAVRIVVSPGGTRIVSGSFDRTIRVWDTQAFWNVPQRQHLQGPDDKMVEIDDDGWVRNEEGKPLLWIPNDVRGDAFSTSLVRIPRIEGGTQIEIDWDRLCVGDRWASILDPGTDS